MPEVITAPPPPVEAAKSLNVWSIVIIAVIGLAVLTFIIIGLYFVISWIIRYFKEQNDLYIGLKKKQMELCSQHAYRKVHRWLIGRNKPIRCAYNNGGEVKITEPIAFYGGHYYSPTGDIIMRIFGHAFKTFWIFPRQELLIINQKAEREYRVTSSDGKTEMRTQQLPVSSVQFNDNEIIITGMGISNLDAAGLFYVPVLKDTGGSIINLSVAAFQSITDIAVGDALLGNAKLYVEASRRGVEMNPYIRGIQKIQDTSQTIEQPQAKYNPPQ
jgi:hypothetical protein